MAQASIDLEVRLPPWVQAWQRLLLKTPPWWHTRLIYPTKLRYEWRVVGASKWKQEEVPIDYFGVDDAP